MLYQTEDGSTRIDVRLQDETLWLTQMQMAELIQKTRKQFMNTSLMFMSKVSLPRRNCPEFPDSSKEGKRKVERDLASYNLDVVISVGYRVKSIRGTQFRIWATQRLKEYLIKGFRGDLKQKKLVQRLVFTRPIVIHPSQAIGTADLSIPFKMLKEASGGNYSVHPAPHPTLALGPASPVQNVYPDSLKNPRLSICRYYKA